MDQVQAGPQAQPAQLTGFQDPTFTAETQLTGDAGLLGVLQSATQADVEAGRATRVGETIQVDPLRARLIRDARDALGEGLTEREERQIAEAARARANSFARRNGASPHAEASGGDARLLPAALDHVGEPGESVVHDGAAAAEGHDEARAHEDAREELHRSD